MEHDKKLGVSVEYNADCQPVFTSAVQAKKYAKAHGYVHRNFSY